MKQRLINHIQSITDPSLRKTCESILTYDKFFTCPASLSFHHTYEGGLLAHTVEVCDIVMSTYIGSCSNSTGKCIAPLANTDVLTAAALFHDLMKIEEYRTTHMPLSGQRNLLIPDTFPHGVFWVATDYQKKIGHICGSAAQFQVAAAKQGVDRETIDAVTHCILAHHGRKEWGSPVEPQTLEALILHQADMLSANYGATKDQLP